MQDTDRNVWPCLHEGRHFLSGTYRAMPTIDNLVVLAAIFEVRIDNIIVINTVVKM